MSEPVHFTSNVEADRRYHQRNHIEKLLDRAKYLNETDRALIDQVYRYGSSLSSVARVSGQPAANLRRQMAKLSKAHEFPFVHVHDRSRRSFAAQSAAHRDPGGSERV